MFSTFYVITQVDREQMVRREAVAASAVVNRRVDALQAQVSILSAQVNALTPVAPLNTSSTVNTLPTAKPAKK